MKTKIPYIFLVFLLLINLAYALSAPQTLSVNFNPGAKAALISWSAVPDAAGFNVYRKETTDPDFQKINFSAVTSLNFKDTNIIRGKDYLYMVRALDPQGAESGNSVSAGGPQMTIINQALVTTMRDKPLSRKSIKTGKLVTFAAPGDIITYRISYINKGCSSAKNVSINYDIPSGTTIAGVPIIKKGAAAQISYFDRTKNKWVSQIEKEGNISKIRFLIPESIPPVKNDTEVNGIIDLNVLIVL
jgi:uncharacterized repeat protein (TIGR01451 family)